MPRSSRASRAFIHICAATAALLYAWTISQSAYVTTGLQFVTPVLVIMLTHLVWLTLTRQMAPGFSSVIYRRSAQTAAGMAAVIFTASLIAPSPGIANFDALEFVQIAFIVVFCVAVIAIICGLIALCIYILFQAIKWLTNRAGPNGPRSRLFDYGSLVAASLLLAVFSLEGHPVGFSFAPDQQSGSTVLINAPPQQVWQVMETATSPDVPLPGILMSFPQPTEVAIDEGTALGATRKVAFAGREGRGFLTLHVVERSATHTTFETRSDTSPFAQWVGFKRLTYQVTPKGAATELTVSLQFDRLLAPAWFFTPITRAAASLAMGVLAGDVKARAEALPKDA
ncbi:MAG: SRPBCC family protein [Pseudomonadota bacterium]